MAAWHRYQFSLKAVFTVTTVCAVCFALIAAALAGSEAAALALILPVLLIVFVLALLAGLIGVVFVAYLAIFSWIYAPLWALHVGYSRLAALGELWLWRLSPKWRRALSMSVHSASAVFVLAVLPKPIQQILAIVAAIAFLTLLPTIIVAGIAIVFGVIEAHRYQFSLRSMLLFVAVGSAAALCLPNARPVDWLFGIAFGEETIYSDGYSMWRWSQLRRGMTKQAVLKLLGPPLKTFAEREEVWHYTRYGPSETYHGREVVFKNSVVVEKRAELWVD